VLAMQLTAWHTRERPERFPNGRSMPPWHSITSNGDGLPFLQSVANFYSSAFIIMNLSPADAARRHSWNPTPHPLIRQIWQQLPAGCNVLDLGCGSGRDTLFLAQQGFHVTAVDRSPEVIQQLQFTANQLALKNIRTICHSIDTLTLPDPSYELINMANVLHFLAKETAIELLDRVKNSLPSGGQIIIQAFTTKDVLFQTRRHKAYFETEELRTLFADFDIELCEDQTVVDRPHPGFDYPHEHHILNFIGRRPSPTDS